MDEVLKKEAHVDWLRLAPLRIVVMKIENQTFKSCDANQATVLVFDESPFSFAQL